MAENSVIPAERIEKAIYVLRGQRVMLDEDLAELYGVTTKRLNEQVKRNHERFPSHFMFQLTLHEFIDLRSQIVTPKWGGRRTPPKPYLQDLRSGRCLQGQYLLQELLSRRHLLRQLR